MEDNQSLTTSNEFYKYFDVLFDQFGISMQALQLQDLHGSEQALIKAKNIYRSISVQVQGNENIFFKILVNYIEITTCLLRSTFYSLDERFKRSLEELENAKSICDEVNLSFGLIPRDFVEEEGIEGMLEMIKFTFFFFESVVLTTRDIIQGNVLKNEGKYVDEIQMFRNAVLTLRRMNDHDFGVVNPDNNNYMVIMISMLNRFAEVYEKRIERLEEKRKKIEFLPPIGNKVFIIHGHSEAILRELKEILRSTFKIEPIILTDELDNGNTVIEKFEYYGRLCAFAFVIVTPDDWVENKKKKYFQARPNVLFELGWFCGRYGRDKVRILRQKETPLPSDLNGIITIDFNEKLEEVFRRINRDLQSAGIIE